MAIMGLELSINTGGCLKTDDETDAKVSKGHKFPHFNIKYDSGNHITCIESELFMKSVKSTEKSLKVKLFT